jgi:hypothetical protein
VLVVTLADQSDDGEDAYDHEATIALVRGAHVRRFGRPGWSVKSSSVRWSDACILASEALGLAGTSPRPGGMTPKGAAHGDFPCHLTDRGAGLGFPALALISHL